MHHRRMASWLAVPLIAFVLAACGGGGRAVDTEGHATRNARGGNGGGHSGGGGGGTASGVALVAEPGVRSITLSWADIGATQYNVYLASSPGCDITRYSLCPDGRLLSNAKSPQKIDGLVNGRVVYARVEAITSKGNGLSNEAGARPNTASFDGAVRAVAVAADGTTYLGGEFTTVGITAGAGAALDIGSGHPSVPDFPIVAGGDVAATAADGAGGWYIGGDFQRIGSVAKKYLAHMRADGTVDTGWNPVPSGSVRAMAVMGGIVYIGGTFTTINGQKRTGLAAIDASGSLTAWNPDPNQGVLALAAANGTVYVGGPFSVVGAFPRGHLAAIDANANVLPWNPNADNTVMTLAVSGTTVYAGGTFSSVSGQARACIAAIDASGNVTAWDAPLAGCPGAHVRSIAVAGGTVYVGGAFAQIGRNAAARNALAAIDADGNALAWNPDPDGFVDAVAVANDALRGTTVFAGGAFTHIGGRPYHHLAAIDALGAAQDWKPAPNGDVQALAVAGSLVYAGGRFTGLGAVTRNFLAALDRNGAPTVWDPNANGSVLSLAITGNGIYAGGDFSTIAGQPRQRLAVIDAAGQPGAWSPGANGSVRTLAASASTLYVGGEFTSAGGLPRNHLAAFGVAGELLTWDPNADREVHALAVSPDLGAGESVYVGGAFTAVGGQQRRRLAQINTQGFAAPWNPQALESIPSTDVVHALRFVDGVIYVGGQLSQIGAIGRRNLAAIGSGGNLLSWAPAANSVVWTLDVSNGIVVVGGEFTQIYNVGPSVVTRNGLAAIDTNGTLTAWDPNVNGTVYSTGIANGTIEAGGAFTEVGDQITSGFVMLVP